ncbi:hypothetical protein CN984_12085 [Bacillus cereus]|uniref:Uncharacterized protein n=1 Tax=Bacillus cereus TaxID=1396 RepID=A0A2A7FP74_BACCE|nr:hypothetical protein [Bacillus cereus]PEA25841.1 hypothetical protein CON44_18010 [Bacillus cereus]PGO29178.1 hypothetical protein CN984_12085 [Bacillus cereus]
MSVEKNELKKMAKDLVWIQDKLKEDTLYEWDRDELVKQADKIRMDVVLKGYSVDLFVRYMEEYPMLSVDEYMKWIKE